MKCEFCREELPEGAKICPLCGAVVNDEASSEYTSEYTSESTPESQYTFGMPEQSPNQQNQEQQSYNYGQQNYSQQNYYEQKPINGTLYLVLSILATLTCCLPLGIAGIVFSSSINSKQRNGDYEGARSAAKNTKIILIICVVFAIISAVATIAAATMGFKNVLDASDSEYLEDFINEEDDALTGDLDGLFGQDIKVAPTVDSLGDDWDSYTIQIKDKVIALPCEYAELKELGFSLDKNMVGDDDDDIVNSKEYSYKFLSDKDGNSIMVDLINPDDTDKEIEECLVAGISLGIHDINDIKIVFPGNIEFGASVDEVEDIYGEAEDVYEGDDMHMYTWADYSAYYSVLEASFGAKSGELEQVTLRNYGF